MICGLSLGADGAIGTSYNYMAKTAASIYKNFNDKDMAAALKCQRKLNLYIDAFYGKNIASWKSSMRALGIDVGYTVFPANQPSEEEYAAIYRKLTEIGIPEIG